MMTQAPLPEWRKLFNAMWRKPLAEVELAKPWHRKDEIAGWLSRSAWSLALIALWRIRLAPLAKTTVWIPDYFCNSSLHALRMTGVRLVFYPLTLQMDPDMDACRELAKTTPPDVFLLVHYFGRPVKAAGVCDLCKFFGAWLVEDAAHVLRPLPSVGTSGDFVVYSPHKHLPIPDGSLLVVRSNGPSFFDQASLESFGSPNKWVGQLGELIKKSNVSLRDSQSLAKTWLVKRLLQKLGFRRWGKATTEFAELEQSGEDVPINMIAPSMSRLANQLLSGQIGDLGHIARSRQRHQLFWDALLSKDELSEKGSLILAERSEGRTWTPYLGAYQINTNSSADSVFKLMEIRGLPVTTWPDLPPEVKHFKERHANAWHLRHSRIYLPVHQTLQTAKMFKDNSYREELEETKNQIRLIWDEVSAEQWNGWLVVAGRSNLLQSWAYGESKSADSGWRVKRGVFFRENEAIALVQLLEKSVAGILHISRVNRGPIFLESPKIQDVNVVWKKLSSLGNIFLGKVISVAPELELTGEYLLLMQSLGFRQFSPNAWESVWVDLRPESSELRKRLNAKWRNSLVSAEKHGLRLESGTDDLLFEWMMERYSELMLEKGFVGIPISVLMALRKNLPKESQLLILRAMDNGEAIAGICLIRHGAAATYLVGWNGLLGRQLKANQFLLWSAMTYLKQSEMDWFDVGGVNEDDMLGISAFKLGINGKRYESVGEYWKW